MAHVSKSHPSSGETLSYGQINDVSPPIETAAAMQCPFCDEAGPSEGLSGFPTPRGLGSMQNFVRIDWYQQHLSHHMEQLALLAKSASVGDDEVGDDSDAEALSQAGSSDTTEQSDDPEIESPTLSHSFHVEPLAVDSGAALQALSPKSEIVGDQTKRATEQASQMNTELNREELEKQEVGKKEDRTTASLERERLWSESESRAKEEDEVFDETAPSDGGTATTLSAVSGALATSIKITEKVYEIIAVGEQSRNLLATINQVNHQLETAKTLRRQKCGLLSASEKVDIEQTFASTEEALNHVARLVEKTRVDQQIHGGKVAFRSKKHFVLRDSPNIVRSVTISTALWCFY
jgi:hypothetical protein